MSALQDRLGYAVVVSHSLYGTVQDYFKDPKHRAEFQRWYKEKYGKHYKWRRLFP